MKTAGKWLLKHWMRYFKFRRLIRELQTAFEEASQENWDGYNAQPADPESYRNARRFLLEVDPKFLPDEVCVLPDGDSCFDWFREDGGLSLAVDAQGEFAFSGDFKGEKFKGKGNVLMVINLLR